MLTSGNEHTLKEVIKELLNAYRLNDGITEAQLIESWGKTAGPYVAKFTERISIRNGIMYLKISSPALKNELIYARNELIETLNNSINKKVIKEIVFL